MTDRLNEPLSLHFADDGLVPNNPLPLLIYRRAVAPNPSDLERSFEDLFARNGWGQQMWRDGIFDYLHYHATVHEVLGVARGTAVVRFGGERGESLALAAGDVAILPAGTGHQRLEASADFSVVGGYPPGDEMRVTRPTAANHAAALKTIPAVLRPATDPVTGANGRLIALWRTDAR